MTPSTSSANPATLIHYADTARGINSLLEHEAVQLEGTLATFAASCTEPRTGIGSDLASPLRAYVLATVPGDEWVRQVSNDFLNADHAPVPPWLTAPFAGAGTMPRRVPIYGQHGVVPTGYGPKGQGGGRLYLYMGRYGTDTLFGVHPLKDELTGKAPKPILRLDYGPIKTKGGTTPLPNGGSAPILKGQKWMYFHWNVAGNTGVQGQGKPLWTHRGTAIRDHQLWSNNSKPRPNVIGSVKGGTLIRGASRASFVVGAAVDTYNIANADNKVKESVKVAGGWAGAWAGAKVGATAGVAIGSIFPGPGNAIGAAAGGLIGGAIGYLAGSKLGEKIHGWF